MNRQLVLSNLREAHEELTRLIQECETTRRSAESELGVGLMHLYHHLNTAWNARDVSRARARRCVSRDFRAWSRYPRDLEPLGVA